LALQIRRVSDNPYVERSLPEIIRARALRRRAVELRAIACATRAMIRRQQHIPSNAAMFATGHGRPTGVFKSF